MRTPIWLAGLGALVIGAVPAAQERPGPPRPGVVGAASGLAVDEIQGHQIAAHVQFLADNLLEGHASSSRGGAVAARCLAARLALPGYEPAVASGTWDCTGAVDDIRFPPALGRRIANAPDVPAHHSGEPFARPRLSFAN